MSSNTSKSSSLSKGKEKVLYYKKQKIESSYVDNTHYSASNYRINIKKDPNPILYYQL